MKDTKPLKPLSHWIPAAFCAALSMMALTLGLESFAWKPAFFSFLPMCFFFAGAVTFQMHREIRDLRKQIADLQTMNAR